MEQRPPGAGRVVDFRPLPTLSSCDHGNSLNGRVALAPATFRMSGIKIRLNVCCGPDRRKPAPSTCRLLGRSGLGEAKGTRITPGTSMAAQLVPVRSGLCLPDLDLPQWSILAERVADQQAQSGPARRRGRLGYFWHHSFALQYDLTASRVSGLGKQHKHHCDEFATFSVA